MSIFVLPVHPQQHDGVQTGPSGVLTPACTLRLALSYRLPCMYMKRAAQCVQAQDGRADPPTAGAGTWARAWFAMG